MGKKNTILIVDDMKLSRMVLRELFSGDYSILEAENGREALELIYRNLDDIAVILLDVVMPVMDGFQTIERLRESRITARIPVVLITAEDRVDTELKGHDLGVSDIIIKPFDPQIVRRRVRNIIDLYQHKNHLEDMLEEQTRRLTETNEFVIDALSTVIEYRNVESGQHIRRIRFFTRTLLESVAFYCPEFHLTNSMVNTISSAAAMHDIGKIAIPDSILLKPGPLTPEEFEVMKTHTTKGCEILKELARLDDQEYLIYSYQICLYHHERWDGGGYPDGLKGDKIPLCAQVVALADCYDALTSRRVYKPAYTHDQAVRMIMNGECGAFAPKLLEVFYRIRDRFRVLARAYADGAEPPAVSSKAEPSRHRRDDSTDPGKSFYGQYYAALNYIEDKAIEVDLDANRYMSIGNRASDGVPAFGDYDEMVEMAIDLYVHPSDREMLTSLILIQPLMEAFRKGKDQICCEFRKREPGSGNYQWNRITLVRIRTGDAALYRALCFVRNVHSLRTTQEQTQMEHQRFLTALRGGCLDALEVQLDTGACTAFLSRNSNEAPEKIEHYGKWTLKKLPIHPDERKDFQGTFGLDALKHAFQRADAEIRREYRLIGEDNAYHWTEFTAAGIRQGTAACTRCMIFVQDAERKKQDLENSKQAEARLSAALRGVYGEVFELNVGNGWIHPVKSGKQRFLKAPPNVRDYEDLISYVSSHFIHPDDRNLYLQHCRRESLKEAFLNGADQVYVEYRRRGLAGGYRWCSSLYVREPSENGDLLAMAFVQDIQDQRKNARNGMEEKRDPLTGLANREGTEKAVSDYLARRQKRGIHSLFVIRLNRFHQYSEPEQDIQITLAAERLRACFRATDILGRVQTDEFAVLVKNLPEEQIAEETAARVREVLEQEEGDARSLDVSVGSAQFQKDGLSYGELLAHAETML